mgnify:FL=1
MVLYGLVYFYDAVLVYQAFLPFQLRKAALTSHKVICRCHKLNFWQWLILILIPIIDSLRDLGQKWWLKKSLHWVIHKILRWWYIPLIFFKWHLILIDLIFALCLSILCRLDFWLLLLVTDGKLLCLRLFYVFLCSYQFKLILSVSLYVPLSLNPFLYPALFIHFLPDLPCQLLCLSV